MKRLLWLLIGAVALLISPSPLPATTPQIASAQDAAVPSIEWLEKCRFDTLFLPPDIETLGQTIICGILHTYEDPTDAHSTPIQVAFSILSANDEASLDDPVVFLQGGPGGSALFYIDPWVTSPIRQQRDIILIDQRGTGYSLPSLSCSAYLSRYYFSSEADIQSCVDQLRTNGVDLGHYNTDNNAHDIGELLALLKPSMGYSNYNLLGISYGTRLGLAIMRDYPDLIRSAILDSVYPQVVDHYAELGPNLQRALEAVFSACQREDVCNTAYPNLEHIFYEVLEDMNENDDEYVLTNFLNTIFMALYSKYRIQALPAVIYLYSEGRQRAADNYLYYGITDDLPSYDAYYDSYDSDMLDDYFQAYYELGHADAFYMALQCQEEFYFTSYEIAVQFAADSNTNSLIATSQLYDVERMATECPYWFNAAAAPSANERIYSDIPTLVVAGEFDPITPPEWAKVARESLTTSYYFSFPGEGHGVVDGHPCTISIFDAFFDNPLTEPDASCRSEMGMEFFIHPDFD